MARPRHEHPTPAELEVLEILWDSGPATVRQVWETLRQRKRRAYTSVMSLMNVMADKGLLSRSPHGKAFIYHPKSQRELTLGRILADVLNRVFKGSATALVASLLGKTSRAELDEIRKTIEQHRHGKGGQS